MLNFRNTLIGFAIALFLVVAADYLIPVSGWIYAGIILVLIALMAWGSKSIELNFYLESHNHGDRSKKSISLTFDDGPDGQVTPLILDLLKENNVKAAFFIIGNRAAVNPEVLKRIDKEGHVIGGHSYSHHLLFDLFSSSVMRGELQKTDNLVFSIIGKRLSLFRPPYGVTNPPIARAIRSMKYESIGWSLKSFDTVNEKAADIFNRIVSNLNNGDIILMHDSKPWTLNVLALLIPYLKEHNFEIQRLDKLLNLKPYVH
jgi:peptidoglycan/xylan/chitin deacetylase (PgdA/CDA1 family)